MEECNNNATLLGEERINLKIYLLGMDNTYLTTEGFSLEKSAIETLAYYMELNKVKDMEFKAMEIMKNK